MTICRAAAAFICIPTSAGHIATLIDRCHVCCRCKAVRGCKLYDSNTDTGIQAGSLKCFRSPFEPRWIGHGKSPLLDNEHLQVASRHIKSHKSQPPAVKNNSCLTLFEPKQGNEEVTTVAFLINCKGKKEGSRLQRRGSNHIILTRSLASHVSALKIHLIPQVVGTFIPLLHR
ncbi:hypothetical protein CC80DRAFT_44729 [Byssothecium circinans]|uniref:Secreted protein n=1 Tax=Byssothecium circinans TaxID=147558 RepID=A0A6A5U389_9PLEO|nr:hypothetical protein CC80DRAFT_44729 [Byssothecium circinans]